MISNKLEEFLSPIMRPWFGATEKTINFRKFMDEQKIVFIKLNLEFENISRLLANIVISQLLDAAYSRRDMFVNSRKQMNVYVDEFQEFANHDFSKLFSEARKYGLGLCIATQVREMIELPIKATCDQARNIFVFQVTPKDADELSTVFDTTPPPGEPIKEKVMEELTIPFTKVCWSPPEKEEEFNELRQRIVRLCQEGHILIESLFPFTAQPNDYTRWFDWKLCNSPTCIHAQAGSSPSTSLLDYSSLDLNGENFIRPQQITPRITTFELDNAEANVLSTLTSLTHMFSVEAYYQTGSMITPRIHAYYKSYEVYHYRGPAYPDTKLISGYFPFEVRPEHNALEQAFMPCQEDIHTLEALGIENPFASLDEELISNAQKVEVYKNRGERDILIQHGYDYKALRQWLFAPEKFIYGSSAIPLDWGSTLFMTKREYKDRENAIYYAINNQIELYAHHLGDITRKRRADALQRSQHRTFTPDKPQTIPIPFEQNLHDYATKPSPDWRSINQDIALDLLTRYRRDTDPLRQNITCTFDPAPSPDHDYAVKSWLQSGNNTESLFKWNAFTDGMLWYLTTITKLYDEYKTAIELADSLKANHFKEVTEMVGTGKFVQKKIFLGFRRTLMSDGDIKEEALYEPMFSERPGNPPYGSDEVARRTANLIKQLPKYTAKVRIATGEYVVETIDPTKDADGKDKRAYIGNKELIQRIAKIQERNVAQGYLRLRSEVSEEIRKRNQPPDEPLAPPSPGGSPKEPPQKPSDNKGAKQPPAIVPTPRTRIIGTPATKHCSACEKQNAATATFCSACGSQF
jgi:hypothetical protein